MALVNGHLGSISEPNYTANTNSSEDLSSPETYLLEEGSSCSAMNYQPSLMNFKGGYDDNFVSSNGSLLRFEQHGRSQPNAYWESSTMSYNHNNYWNQIHVPSDPRIMEDFNCFENSSNFGSIISDGKLSKDQYGHDDWIYSEATTITTDTIPECGLKRPTMGESMQPLKKQCIGASTSRKTKAAGSTPPKDPQSLAAKNRRERISERLKILQELVPNGTKVDLVTMLEKAIGYVKFLQLQVKVLATDEFWPAQGGKAPDISQVKEAIDAILWTQRQHDSSSQQ